MKKGSSHEALDACGFTLARSLPSKRVWLCSTDRL
jgi:hypothetical protein